MTHGMNKLGRAASESEHGPASSSLAVRFFLAVSIVLIALGTALPGHAEQAREPAWDREVQVRDGAFPKPSGAPAAILHGPAGLKQGSRVDIVMFLHGWKGCARVLAGSGDVSCRHGMKKQKGWALSWRHDKAGTNTVFIVPQLGWLKSATSAGKFAERDFAESFFSQVVEGPLNEHFHTQLSWGDVSSITLVAHSAGYKTAQALLTHKSIADKVQNVVLLDALYGGESTFASWLKKAGSDAKLVSVVTKNSQRTKEISRKLARKMKVTPRFDSLDKGAESAVGSRKLVLLSTDTGHGAIPRKHLTELLAALPLPKR